MTVTITYTGATPTIDADEDTWGAELNTDALAPIKADLDALAVQGNATETVAGAALPKAGGTMTGEIKLGDTGPTSTDSAGFRAAPVIDFDADKTLILTDAGKTLRLTGATARTLIIPPVGSVGFPVGTVIVLRNSGSAALTVARGSGVVLTLAGSATNKNCAVATRGQATLLHEATNNWVLSGVGVS